MTDPDGEERSAGSAAPDADAPSRTSRSDADAPNRRRAALAVVFAPQPLWAFLFVPPVAFMSILTYLTFRSDFLDDR